MFEVNGKQISHKDLNIVRDFFTDEQWDLIDHALSEYQDHDDATEKCKDTLDVIYQLFRSSYQELITLSCIQNETILDTIYDEVWEEFRISNKLTDDQLNELCWANESGTLLAIETETNKRFEDMCQ